MASKKLDKLKTAGADMDKFFSGAEQSEPEEKEEIKVVFKESGKRETPVSTPDYKPVMSIKMDEKKPAKGRSKTAKEEPSESHQKAQEGKKKRKTDSQKVFSFRTEADQADSWRVWCLAKGITVNELGEKAINEYIKKHGLTADQRQIYELKMAQKKS